MATHCLIPVSMSTGNRINKPGYESYQPILTTRQLGLNKTSPRLIIHEKIQSRADISDSLVATKDHSFHGQEQEEAEKENSPELPSSSPKETSDQTDEAHMEVSPPQAFDAASLLNFDPSTIGDSLVTESPPFTPPADVTLNLKDIAKQLETPIEKLVIACDGIRMALEPIIDMLPLSLKKALRPTAHLGFLREDVLAAMSRIATCNNQAALKEEITKTCAAANQFKADLDDDTEEARLKTCRQTLDARRVKITDEIKRLEEELSQVDAAIQANDASMKTLVDNNGAPSLGTLRRDLSFKVDDHVYLKVSPIRGIRRFNMKGKLAPRYIGLFKILEKKGEVAYRLELPSSLSGVYDVFHVSQLKKCLRVPEEQAPLEGLEVQEDLTSTEHPVKILDTSERNTRNKSIKMSTLESPRRFLDTRSRPSMPSTCIHRLHPPLPVDDSPRRASAYPEHHGELPAVRSISPAYSLPVPHPRKPGRPLSDEAPRRPRNAAAVCGHRRSNLGPLFLHH
ncbi:hypothetical protein U9M48_039348 [Paspalum notatum var. saurae]|uniref:Tf2-1-like SH3-like domain-containing protein n=1 Tax=Paspalum notatum var. saurae TaxID=547442 RepID=A0AAQ3UJX8_PASNO